MGDREILAIVASAWVALGLWTAGIVALWCGRVELGRRLYSAGLMVFVAHVGAAFCFAHGWSHADALRHTAEQSEQLTGLRAGWGLWLNYLFGAAWLIDALRWWRIGDAAYAADRGAAKIALRAFALFMFVNGAVVFVTGARRWIGVALLLVLAAGAYRLQGRRDGAKRSAT